jgi:hypothetical protein
MFFRLLGEDSIAFYSVRLYSIFVAVTMPSTPGYQFESEEWAVPHSPSSRYRRRLSGLLQRLNGGLSCRRQEVAVVAISMPDKVVEIASGLAKNILIFKYNRLPIIRGGLTGVCLV